MLFPCWGRTALFLTTRTHYRFYTCADDSLVQPLLLYQLLARRPRRQVLFSRTQPSTDSFNLAFNYPYLHSHARLLVLDPSFPSYLFCTLLFTVLLVAAHQSLTYGYFNEVIRIWTSAVPLTSWPPLTHCTRSLLGPSPSLISLLRLSLSLHLFLNFVVLRFAWIVSLASVSLGRILLWSTTLFV